MLFWKRHPAAAVSYNKAETTSGYRRYFRPKAKCSPKESEFRTCLVCVVRRRESPKNLGHLLPSVGQNVFGVESRFPDSVRLDSFQDICRFMSNYFVLEAHRLGQFASTPPARGPTGNYVPPPTSQLPDRLSIYDS